MFDCCATCNLRLRECICSNTITCKRCGGEYLDGKICPSSGFSLFCAAPEIHYAVENYCSLCDHHKSQHVTIGETNMEQCVYNATPEDGFECNCTQFIFYGIRE